MQGYIFLYSVVSLLKKEFIIYKEQKYIEDIVRNLSFITTTIERFNKLNLYDLNIHSEDFFCNLLNMVYSLNLMNLNMKDKNTPSIDLGDTDKKICYQITSTNDSSKIKNTISKFEKYNLYNNFNELFIFLLKDKKNYTTTFITNGKYKFSNQNIIDINDLILKIKSKQIHEIERISQFIENNLQIFLNFNISSNKPKIENKINTLIATLKTKAIEQYNLDIKVVNNIISEYNMQWYNSNIKFNNIEYINVVYNASLFFNSINESDMKILLDFVNIHINVSSKYATNMFIRYYNSKNKNEIIDSYLLENIIRILKSLKNLLKSEISITFSSGFGVPHSLLFNNSIILSLSNIGNNIHKLIVLDSNKEKIIEPELSLGGISEKVKNIKRYQDLNNLFIFAQSKYHIYIWEPQSSHEPIAICKDNNEIVADYEIFTIRESLHIIAITEQNHIITWKIHHNNTVIIQQLYIERNAYILLNIDGINKLITNNRSAKEIYKYDFKLNQIDMYFKIPDYYNRIISLSIHPKKNHIAFSCEGEKIEDSLFNNLVCDYDTIIQYDIDNEKEFFFEKLEGHFIHKVLYEIDKDDVSFIIYDRDGAGIEYSPLIKKWIESSNQNYNLIYQYNNYSKEKNNFFIFMELFNNNIFINITEEPSIISKLKNDKEIQFYKLEKYYILNDLFYLSTST